MEEYSIDGVIAAERRRGEALVQQDYDSLRAMISRTVTHTHTRGVTDDFDSYFCYIEGELTFLEVTRGPLDVRLFGDAAVMSGEMSNLLSLKGRAEPILSRSLVLQVWAWRGGRWIQEAFQSTSLPETQI
ncbi:nuclear transport factor 2 family protein [Sphingobium sp. EM0848]|uniref:nuclear transport factor 2 family protein n=1 Tax=Sphingobium sp. EM0848 TaxID=2743473 RepID=UPI00159C0DD8